MFALLRRTLRLARTVPASEDPSLAEDFDKLHSTLITVPETQWHETTIVANDDFVERLMEFSEAEEVSWTNAKSLLVDHFTDWHDMGAIKRKLAQLGRVRVKLLIHVVGRVVQLDREKDRKQLAIWIKTLNAAMAALVADGNRLFLPDDDEEDMKPIVEVASAAIAQPVLSRDGRAPSPEVWLKPDDAPQVQDVTQKGARTNMKRPLPEEDREVLVAVSWQNDYTAQFPGTRVQPAFDAQGKPIYVETRTANQDEIQRMQKTWQAHNNKKVRKLPRSNDLIKVFLDVPDTIDLKPHPLPQWDRAVDLFFRRHKPQEIGGAVSGIVSSGSPSNPHARHLCLTEKSNIVPHQPGAALLISSFRVDLDKIIKAATTGGPINVFLKRGPAKWQYCGLYECRSWPAHENGKDAPFDRFVWTTERGHFIDGSDARRAIADDLIDGTSRQQRQSWLRYVLDDWRFDSKTADDAKKELRTNSSVAVKCLLFTCVGWDKDALECWRDKRGY